MLALTNVRSSIVNGVNSLMATFSSACQSEAFGHSNRGLIIHQGINYPPSTSFQTIFDAFQR